MTSAPVTPELPLTPEDVLDFLKDEPTGRAYGNSSGSCPLAIYTQRRLGNPSANVGYSSISWISSQKDIEKATISSLGLPLWAMRFVRCWDAEGFETRGQAMRLVRKILKDA
jgi:hypothetical protein